MSCPEVNEHIIVNGTSLESFEQVRTAILSVSFLPKEAYNNFYTGLMKEENERPNENIS